MLFLFTAALAQVTLFLNDPRGRSGPGAGCVDAHCLALLESIRSTRHTIDFAVYGFRDQPDIVEALEDALQRGVQIRGVVDADADGVNYYASTADVRARLTALGARVHTDELTDRATVAAARTWRGRDRCPRPAGFSGPLQCLGYDLGDRCLLAAHASREPIEERGDILHHKFFVFDERTVWTGSTNVSDSGTGGYNANLVVRVDDPVVARWYTQELEQMVVDGRFHHDKRRSGPKRRTLPDGTHLTGWFSPQDRPITRALRPLLQSAHSTIDVAVFFLTHKHVTADLIAAHRRGVRVRVILDATAAKNGYTKHELLRAAGIPVKVETWGGKMHAKTAVIDGHTVVAGSMNWTSAGEGGNDENTLLLRSPRLGGQVTTWFEALWSDLGDTFLTGRPDPEGPESGSACTDGVDNDFDHRPDHQDPGCGPSAPPLPPLPPWRTIEKRLGEGVLVKGATLEGRELWFAPDHARYRQIVPERWFCSHHGAKDAGYRRAPTDMR